MSDPRSSLTEDSSYGLSTLDLVLQILANCMRFFETFNPTVTQQSEYAVPCLKLALLRLRLLRWSKSAYKELQDGEKISDVEKIMIVSLLSDIEKSLRLAVVVSHRHKSTSNRGEQDDRTEGARLTELTEDVRRLAERRRDDMPTLWRTCSTVRWVLADPQKLDHLIETLSDGIGALIEVLPHLKPAQEMLAQDEAKELADNLRNGPDTDVTFLAEPWFQVAVSFVDADLAVKLQQEAAVTQGPSTSNTAATLKESDDPEPGVTVHGERKPHGEDSVRPQGHVYIDNQASGNAKVVYGDVFGGRYIFDD